MTNTLRIYSLYESEYPFSDVYYLVSGISDSEITGYMFDKTTLKMNCTFTIRRERCQREFREIDYLGGVRPRFTLMLREQVAK